MRSCTSGSRKVSSGVKPAIARRPLIAARSQALRSAHAARPPATGDAAHVAQVGGVPMPRGPGGAARAAAEPGLPVHRARDERAGRHRREPAHPADRPHRHGQDQPHRAGRRAGRPWRAALEHERADEVGDFVGFWTVKGGETIWVDGVLPSAMREGLWLIVDEIDFAEPAILAVLTAVLEPAGRLLLKEKGNEIVVPHPSFRLFATANAVGAMGVPPSVPGANVMNEAFLDCWRVYRLDYLPPPDEARAAAHARPGHDRGDGRHACAIAADCRAAFVREDLASAFSTRRLIDAELMLRTGDPESAAGPTICEVGAEDADLIRSIIRHYIDVEA